MVGHRCRSPLWRMVRKPGRTKAGRRTLMGRTAAVDRLTAGFRYVGPARVVEARRVGVIP